MNYIPVDGGAGPDPNYGASGSGEAALDIEDVIGLAPKATIDVYQGPINADTSEILDVYSAIVERRHRSGRLDGLGGVRTGQRPGTR